MTQIASLPTISVQIAMTGSNGPFTNLSSWTWLDITNDCKDLRTTYGKQHELDQHEASTVQFTLDNRIGQYTPWVTDTKTYNLASGGTTSAYSPRNLAVPMNPVRITATWSSTTYSTFYGYVDSWELQTPDEVNSECLVTCSDLLKVLSNQKLNNTSLYPNLVTSWLTSLGVAWQFVRLGDTSHKVAPAIYASNNWSGANAGISGNAKSQVQGPHLYDISTAMDLSNGTSTTPSGAVVWDDLNKGNASSFDYFIEAWFQAPNVGDVLISNYRPTVYSAIGVKVDQNGKAMLVQRSLGSSATTDTILSQPSNGPDLTDGNWHHVALSANADILGTISFYVDGQYMANVSNSTERLHIPSIGLWIGGTTSAPIAGYSTSAIVADVFIMTDGGTGTGTPDQTTAVADRFRVGNLLGPGPFVTVAESPSSTGTAVTFSASGFKVGQTVTVAGVRPMSSNYNGTYIVTAATADTFTVASTSTGTVSFAGTASTPKTTGYRALEALQVAGVIPAVLTVGSPPLTTSGYSSWSGIPLNLDTGTALVTAITSPVYSRSGGEVALQAADTEVGAFYQKRDGTIRFCDRYTAARSLAAGVTGTLSDQSGSYARYMSDVDVVQDDLDLYTTAQISDASVVTWTLPGNATQIAAYGQRSIIRATDAITTDQGITAKQVGATLLYRNQQPSIRVAKATLGSESGSTTLTTALALDLYSAVAFARRDSSTTVFTGNFIVESISVEFLAEPGSWHATFVLSPFELYGSPYLVLGTTTIGSGTPAKWSAPFGG